MNAVYSAIAVVSVVLPCLNELRHGYLPKILENLAQQQGDHELIAVVSPSQDDTLATLQQAIGWRVIASEAQNRAQRLTTGIAASSSAIVLLHHPATVLPAHRALQGIEQAMADPQLVWGGFHHRFDWDHGLLRFTSWYSNQVRARWGQVLYLDHCIFARKSALAAINGVPDLDIFEDTALSQKLQPLGPPRLLPEAVTTSARRFRNRGVYQQALLNQGLKLMYHSGLDPGWMNRLYERRSQINVTYNPLEGAASPIGLGKPAETPPPP